MAEEENKKKVDKGWPLILPNPNDWHHSAKEIISVIGLLIALIVILGIGYLLVDIVNLYFSPDETNRFSKLRTSLFILAALIGIPFFLWRTWIAQQQSLIAEKQAETARDRAYTELFTKAMEQLGAEKPKKEDVLDKKGNLAKDNAGQPLMREIYVPNIEVRIGAIYALERIMNDSRKDATAIVDTLAAYVRENCGDAQEFECEIPRLSKFRTNSAWLKAIKQYVGDPLAHEEGTVVARARALRDLPHVNRVDIKTALTVIGRRPDWMKAEELARQRPKPDLRNVNLQGWDLSTFHLNLLNLQSAKMQGAYLRGAEMQNADLFNAVMQGADFSEAKIQNAILAYTKMQGVKMAFAQMQGLNMIGSEIHCSDLSNAKMLGVNLTNAQMQNSDLSYAEMQKASLVRSEMQGADLSSANIQESILSNANMNRAILRDSKMQRAVLKRADLGETDLTFAKMQGAELSAALIKNVQICDPEKKATSVIWVDFTKAKFSFIKLQAQLPEMFGHKISTTLPEGMEPPEHWSEADMRAQEGHEQYQREWEAFKKKMGVE